MANLIFHYERYSTAGSDFETTKWITRYNFILIYNQEIPTLNGLVSLNIFLRIYMRTKFYFFHNIFIPIDNLPKWF